MFDKLNQLFDSYGNDRNILITNFSYLERLNLLLDILNDQSKYENEKWFNKLEELVNQDKIIFFTQEESLNFFKNDLNKETKKLIEIFINYLDDEYRIKILEINSEYIDEFISDLICGMKNESLKIEYFKKYKNYFKYEFYITSGMSDQGLIKFLEICREENFKFEYSEFETFEGSVINKIKDLNLRLKTILNLPKYYHFNTQIEYLIKEKGDDNLTSFVIDKLLDNDLDFAFSLIDFIINEQKRFKKLLYLIKYLPKAWNYTKVTEILNRINDINLKRQYISEIIEKLGLTSYSLTSFIMLLKEDDLKIDLLETYKDKVIISDIIISIKNEELRKYVFRLYLTDDECLKKVIKSFDNDNIKLELLNEYYPVMLQDTKIEIIVSLKEDQNKLNLLEQMNFSLEQRWRILLSLKNIKLKMDLLIKETKETMNFGLLHQFIEHDDEIFELKDINFELLEMYSERYNYNSDNLKKIVSKFGYIVLRYIRNKNISDLINCDEESLNKFLNLFNLENNIQLDKNNIDSIYGSLVQRIFRNENIDNVLQLFNYLVMLVETKQKDKLIKRLLEIKNEGLIDFNIDILVNDLFNIERKNTAIDKLNELISDYIIRRRNLYFDKRKLNIKKDLNLEFKYEKKYLLNKFILECDIEQIYELMSKINNEKLSNEAIGLKNSKKILIMCIEFKRSVRDFNGDLNLVKQNLKYFGELLEILYIENYDSIDRMVFNKDPLKKIMNVRTIGSDELMKIISTIDINLLKDYLFNNEKLYNELMKTLKKYKFLGWDNIFDNLLVEADIEFDSDAKANVINYFYKYYPILEDKVEKGELKTISLTSILDLVVIYSSVSSVYNILLGKEDYNLIATNPTPNAAQLDKSERLKKIPDKIRELYERKYITVPPIEKEFDINDKSLRVTIGNVRDTINLTYGERTGACMRIGGAGESLFNFCLKNENGFHVMITDPKTNLLVSRVSGFRNGNTIFLNQLRYSLNREYTEKELIELIRKVSKYIIEITKDSQYPIENVIISSGYAMKSEESKMITLNKDIKEGFDYFYSDVSSDNAILLATAKEDGTISELKFNKDNVPRYSVLRQKVKIVTEPSEITRLKTRMHIISGLIDGKTIIDIMPNIEIPTILHSYLYVGEDWYIELDDNNNILNEYCINSNVPRTLSEMEEVKKDLLNKKR